MTVTVVPSGHFSGQRAITHDPSGSDTRDLRTIINQVIALANANESNITGLGTPLDLKGSVTLPADFPAPTAVETGWTYIVAADVTDSDGTKTNTGQSFKAGDEIAWNGTDWTRLGRKVTELTAHDYQDVAASGTTQVFMAMAAGKINDVIAVAETAAAAGEDMALDVQINGVTCLTSAITIDSTSGTTPEVGTVDTAANTLARGDLITVVRTYTAGGGPTPMAGTHLGIRWEENLSA